MQPNRIYLLHPVERYLPGAATWAVDVRMVLQEDKSWDNWDLFVTAYDEQNSFAVQPLFVRVLNKPGPVILLEKVQRKALEELRTRVGNRTVILVQTVTEAEGLWELLQDARERFQSGEPFLPRKFLVAVMIVRKLRKGNYWGGKAKGFLWHDDLARGRGVDERYADIAHEVANDLLQHEVLIFKTSQGAKKYALNPKRKPEVHAIANDGSFWNTKLNTILMKDKMVVSAFLLNQPKLAKQFVINSQGLQTLQFLSVTDAITHARSCQDCPQYQVEVRFEGDDILHEVIKEKRILIQFLEGFL